LASLAAARIDARTPYSELSFRPFLGVFRFEKDFFEVDPIRQKTIMDQPTREDSCPSPNQKPDTIFLNVNPARQHKGCLRYHLGGEVGPRPQDVCFRICYKSKSESLVPMFATQIEISLLRAMLTRKILDISIVRVILSLSKLRVKPSPHPQINGGQGYGETGRHH